MLGTQGVVIRDELPGEFLVRLAHSVGDVNGDGFSDLGIFWVDSGSVVFEEFYLLYGASDVPSRLTRQSLSERASVFVQADSAFGSFGSMPRVRPAGDLDRDGFDDFFIADRRHAPLEYSEIELLSTWSYLPGLVYLVYGSSDIGKEIDLTASSTTVHSARFSSTKPDFTEIGDDLSAGGDFNGDGTADIAIAAGSACMEGCDGTAGPGRVYIAFGREGRYSGLLDLEELGSTLPGLMVHGDYSGQGFGRELAFAGDVNGDGFDDLLIGATRWAGSAAVGDHVLLLFGDDDLPGRLSANEAVAEGYAVRFLRRAVPSDSINSFESLGDVNGDGLADFVVGAPGESLGRGGVYVVPGRREFAFDEMELAGLIGAGGATRFYGGGPPDVLVTGNGVGVSVATTDYDSDGIVDLVIGSAREVVRGVQDVGEVYIVKGPFEGGNWSLEGVRTGEIEGALLTTEIPEWLGAFVYDAGDVNGDEAPDLMVAAPYIRGDSPSRAEPGLSPDPSVYVVFGTGGRPAPLRLDEVSPSVGPLEGGAEVTLLGQGFNDDVEIQIAGRDAVVLRVETSARLVVAVPPGKAVGEVEITVRRGGELVRESGLFRYVSPFYPDLDVDDLAGSGRGLVIDAAASRATVLDHDGDGFGDVVIDSADGVLFIYGRATKGDEEEIRVGVGVEPAAGSARLRFTQEEGHSPFAIGDVNDDGREDLAVISDGLVTVVFGGGRIEGSRDVGQLLETGRASVIIVSGSNSDLQARGGADATGDGVGDLLLFGRRNAPVWLIRGRTDWPPVRGRSGEPNFRTLATEDRFGQSATLVGDADGDGLSEILIGAPGIHWSDRGAGFLVFGSSDWSSELVQELGQSGEALEFASVKERDSLGFTTAPVGDFNGDGFADIALGAKAGSLEFGGESYVVFGGPDLRSIVSPFGLADLALRGVRIRPEFGYDEAIDLAAAGDFNGDGKKDLLISGGNFTSSDNPFPSRSFVVFGGAEGLLDLAKLDAAGFRITCGEHAESVGGTDFNGDGFDDVVVRSEGSVFVVFGSGVPLDRAFSRADANSDNAVNISDAQYLLNFLFLGGATPACEDAADINDDGAVNISDAQYLLNHLFLGGPAPTAPYPEAGQDPTADRLGCRGA